MPPCCSGSWLASLGRSTTTKPREMPGAASPRSSTRICGVRLIEDTRPTTLPGRSLIRAGGYGPPFACQTAGSSQVRAPAPIAPSSPERAHYAAWRAHRVRGGWAAASTRLSTTRRGGAPHGCLRRPLHPHDADDQGDIDGEDKQVLRAEAQSKSSSRAAGRLSPATTVGADTG